MWLVNLLAYRTPVLFLDNFWHELFQVLSTAAAPELGKYGRRGKTLLVGSHRFGPEIVRKLIWAGMTLWQPGRPRLSTAELRWLKSIPKEPCEKMDPAPLIADASGLTNAADFLYQLSIGQWFLASPYGQRFGKTRHAYLCMPEEVYRTHLLYDIVNFWLLVDK
jgi:hypothetical protein